MATLPDEPAEPAALALAADFPPATRDEWRDLVTAVLTKSGVDSGDDPLQSLTFTTYDGIDIAPLYTAADASGVDDDGRPGQSPFVRGATDAADGWQVCTRYDDPQPKQINRAILEDLERGATALWLKVGADGIAPADLGAALAGVYLDLAPITLDAGADTAAAAQALFDLARRDGIDLAGLRGSFGADPIGVRARSGVDADLDALATLVGAHADAPGMRIATVDATVYHDAGASDAQELGIGTAVGLAYLRALTDAGMSVGDALPAIGFRWAVTAEQFPSIAKLRAARQVWDRVAQLCEASAERRGQPQHAVTSAAMMTQRDPWVNMLRTTIACFAAAIGGADTITVTPFDAAIGESDDFARRIARNTHAVLHDESSLGRVLDAAGGSWFVETLTDQLAAAAWDVFTEIERTGGALAALDDGVLDSFVERTVAARSADVAHRRAPITGVSEFAFVDEGPVTRPPRPVPAEVGTLRPRRYAAPFEALRDRADAAAKRPTIFLAALGPAAAHSARLAFATNLFAAGGIAPVVGTVDRGGSAGTAQIVEAFRDSDATVACICGPDQVYEHAAGPVAAALREAGARLVLLAGPHDIDSVDECVYTGCDAIAVLGRTLDALEVTP